MAPIASRGIYYYYNETIIIIDSNNSGKKPLKLAIRM